MRFTDRQHAADLLAGQLQRFKGQQPLVLGVPRGGVPMAKIVAERLGCEFDVVLVRKLRTPEQPELAMGAVDEAGHVYAYGNKAAVRPELYAEEVAAQVAEIRRRRQLYSSTHPQISPQGHTAIIVDDGIATGASMVAAIRAVRAERPLRIVVAVPVAARSSLDLAKSYADEVVCLYSPRVFFAVGDFYDDFSAVPDSTVVELLDSRSAHAGPSSLTT
jgi:putative phosphoribosyl transferase